MLQVQEEFFERSKTGFLKIGEGCYGSVFASPCGKQVYKQSFTDDGALAWLAFCQTQQGRKGVPEIESLVLHPHKGFGVFMKRYESCERCNPHHGEAANARGDVLRDSGIGDYRTPIGAYAGDYHIENNKKLRVRNPDFLYLFDLLDDFANFCGFVGSDLHDGNIMWCKDTGSYVITDPSGRHIERGDLSVWLRNTAQAEFTLQ